MVEQQNSKFEIENVGLRKRIEELENASRRQPQFDQFEIENVGLRKRIEELENASRRLQNGN